MPPTSLPGATSTSSTTRRVEEEESRETTTISTIAVRAGDHATIVIALLKSMGYVELRIEEMKPNLLAIGGSVEETSALLNIHEDLLNRLRDKEDQVAALLNRADNLSAEKSNRNEAIVYDAMAKSLHHAWRELNRQLLLRGYLLKETLSFYHMANHHEELTSTITEVLKKAMSGDANMADTQQAIGKLESLFNEIIDTTANAVDAGSSVISQIRALGQMNDSPGRANEILDSCMLIEMVMLRIASEWERVEQTWQAGRTQKSTETVEETLIQVEEWLTRAERRVKAVNETGQKILMLEGQANQARLSQISSPSPVDQQKVSHLSGRIEEFLHYLKTRMNRSNRISAFFQAAQSMLSQLSMMHDDVRNANAAMAGELAPLARQKAGTVLHEGRDILAKEVLSHDEQRLIRVRCEEIENRLRQLEALAEERKKAAGNEQVNQEFASTRSWLSEETSSFLAQKGELGHNLTEAQEFIAVHSQFAQSIMQKDSKIVATLRKRTEMSTQEQSNIQSFEQSYDLLKRTVENRIRLGKEFEQVHRFAKDLESSFDALTSLLDTNRDFANERVAEQMDHVFHMIEDTMSTEKEQVERFVVSAQQTARSDSFLRIENAVTSARNLIVDHENRFKYITAKWFDWQQQKNALKKNIRIIEEIEMWQEETFEIIKLLGDTTVNTLQESEDMLKRLHELRHTAGQQRKKVEETKESSQNEQFTKRTSDVLRRQEIIDQLVSELEKKTETIHEHFLQEEMEEKVVAPQILPQLRDAQVDEGSRFEFVSRIEGEPEPTITWLKDGIDIRNNMDYRQEFVNGVASLVIEETFIEDTAVYTVRATNKGGQAESSARLIVKSRSAVSSMIEEEKPRFVKQLKNVTVTEGETLRLDSVVYGKPEPEVIWSKDEKIFTEDHRTTFEFKGDHCSMVITETKMTDQGLYTARARNVHGEATSFAQVKVLPRKQPPPVPPKPTSRPQSRAARAPTIQPQLVNTTWQEGDTVKMQVYTQGEPRPVVTWYHDDKPVVETKDVKITETNEGWNRLIIENVKPVHGGLYTVTAVNEAGEARSGATLQVQQRLTTTETMFQDEATEIVKRPVETTIEESKRTALEVYEEDHYEVPLKPKTEEKVTREEKRWDQYIEENVPAYVPAPETKVEKEVTETMDRRSWTEYSQPTVIDRREDTSSVTSEKRWHEIIEEQMSQPSPVEIPIPKETLRKTTTMEQRWVDEIDELLGSKKPKEEKKETIETTAENYVKLVDEMMREMPHVQKEVTETTTTLTQYAHQIHEPSPAPIYRTTETKTTMENVGEYHEAIQPDVRQATVTPSSKMFNVATIRQSPVPESHIASMVRSHTPTEHAAAIRQTPIPETQQASITKSPSLSNIAAIRQTPVPESGVPTTTRKTPVESVATIRQSPVPESHRATLSRASSLENVAAIRKTPIPETGVASTTSRAGVENVAAIRKTPVPESGVASTTSRTPVENVAAIRKTPVPESGVPTTTSRTGVENVAAIRKTPVPESGVPTTTTRGGVESVAAIRKTPVPESGVASTTSHTGVENVAAIRQTPIPESGRASTTPGSLLENVAKSQLPIQPEVQPITQARPTIDRIDDIIIPKKPKHSTADVRQVVTETSAVEHYGEKRPPETLTHVTRSEEKGEIVDQTHTQGKRGEEGVDVKTTVEEGQTNEIVTGQIPGQEGPVAPPRVRRGPEVTKEVTTTTTGEGWIQHRHDEAVPETTTTTTRKVTEDEDVRKKQQKTQIPGPITVKKTTTETEETSGIQRYNEAPQPLQTTTTVTTTTTVDGGVQRYADHAAPEQTTTTKTTTETEEETRRRQQQQAARQPDVTQKTTVTTEEESAIQRSQQQPQRGPDVTRTQTTTTLTTEEQEAIRRQQAQRQPETITKRTTTIEEEEEERRRQELLRRAAQPRPTPQTTKTVTTVVTEQGAVQHLDDRFDQPVTSTTSKEDIESGVHRTIQTKIMQPSTETTKTTTVMKDDQVQQRYGHYPSNYSTIRSIDENQRDSLIVASDAEGFWTDGAYTGSPTPPPVPQHRSITEEEYQKNIVTSEPQFIRGFQKEYTVEEGGSITIECSIVGNPKPKVRFFFNDRPIQTTTTTFCQITQSNDTYSISIHPARLEHAGYYKMTAENKSGYTETLTVLHVRPSSLGRPVAIKRDAQPANRGPVEHTTVTEEFAMFEYEQRRPQKHEGSKLVTPPPAKRIQQTHTRDEELLETYDMDGHRVSGKPPHFTHTLVSTVTAEGEGARFEGIVTGWPAPTVEWTKDGVAITRDTLPDIQLSNIGGRVSLTFNRCTVTHGGKYMCTAKNSSGVATSSAQLVVRPKTVAPDFIQRLISEEVEEGQQLKWTVRVTGDPTPRVIWLRDGMEIPNCDEVRLLDEGNGLHSLLIVRVEPADSGQFTCLAENVAGEARSTADLVVRPAGTTPGSYFHVTKVTQEKQVKGEEPVRNSAFTIETPNRY